MLLGDKRRTRGLLGLAATAIPSGPPTAASEMITVIVPGLAEVSPENVVSASGWRTATTMPLENESLGLSCACLERLVDLLYGFGHHQRLEVQRLHRVRLLRLVAEQGRQRASQ